jgi:DNA (cytosine-5)-methyltransferase 1
MSNFTAIDLFCGAGGLSEGFRQAGFSVLAGNDLDGHAGETFVATHKDAKFFPGPVQSLRASQLLKQVGLRRGELTCLVGGPPCQGFSVYNHQRGMHDERSSLYREYLRLVEGLYPEWVVLENVTGITSAGNGAAVDAIAAGLRSLGYVAEYRILKAEEYGVPQERRRFVIVGTRIADSPVFPEATHGAGMLPKVNVYDAICDLPPLKNGEHKGVQAYVSAPVGEFQAYVRAGSVLVTNHSAPRLAAINLERMKHIPRGGSWRDIPFHLLPEGMKRAKRSDHTKRYGRLSWDKLASTILTKCDVHWGAFIHPDQDRALTVREAARFQSFPDWFEFHGSRTDQFIQVGNAVPPLLGRRIAQTILETATRFKSPFLIAAE